jgi:hypothetical protein
MRGPILVALLLAAVAGCKEQQDSEFPDLGKSEASNEPPPGVWLPIEPGDTAAVEKRGVLLHQLERALRLGYEEGAYAVGVPEGDTIMPLVDVDPGGRSAQVLFVRWDRKQKGKRLHPAGAERWLLVSMLLDPERILDRELLAGKVKENTPTFHRTYAMLVAAQTLADKTPGEVYHLFTVAELMPTEKKKKPVKIATRVYALSAEGDGPDMEVLVDQPKRKSPPVVLDAKTIHEAGAAQAEPLQVAAPHPAPATVARVMAKGPSAGDVPVAADSGVVYTVSARNGRITLPQ